MVSAVDQRVSGLLSQLSCAIVKLSKACLRLESLCSFTKLECSLNTHHMAANVLQLNTVVIPLQIFEQNEAVCFGKGASASKMPSMKNLANVVTDDCFNLVHLLFLCHSSSDLMQTYY